MGAEGPRAAAADGGASRRWLVGGLAVALGFALAGLAMMWPLPRHLLSGIPGDGFDGWQNYWNLWWVRRALLVLGQSPWYTTLLDYPAGVSLLFHTLNVPNALLSMPLQELLGLAGAYNSVVVTSFALSGLGTYLLALRVLRRRGPVARAAALLAGAVYAFSPFHFAHLLGHMQVFALQWLPFSCLALWGLLDGGRWRGRSGLGGLSGRDGRGGRGRVLGGAWAGRGVAAVVFLVLAGLTDWYGLLYLGLLSVLWWVWFAWDGRRRLREAAVRGRLLAPVAAWAGALLLLAPLLVPMVREAWRSDYMVTDASQITALSADLLAFVLPQEMHPLWGDWATGAASRFTSTTSERMVSLGALPLVLAAVAAWRARGRLRLWLWTGLAFAVLSLGPVLHVLGQVASIGGRPVVLPYALLYRLLPFMGIARSVGRFSVVAVLAVAVLAAVAACRLVRRWPRRGPVAIGLAIAWVCFEFVPAPYGISPLETPAWAEHVPTAADGAVLNLPVSWDRPQYLLHQTVHGLPLVSGYTSRRNPTAPVEQYPGLQQLRALGDDVLAFPDALTFASIAADLGLRYVVLDAYQMPGDDERGATLALTGSLLGGREPVYRDERFTVYVLDAAVERRPYLRLTGAYGPRVIVDGVPQRAVCAECGLEAVSEVPLTVRALCGQGAPVEVTLAPGSGVALGDVEPACRVLLQVTWSPDRD